MTDMKMLLCSWLLLLLAASNTLAEEEKEAKTKPKRLYNSTCDEDTEWNTKNVAKALKDWIESISVKYFCSLLREDKNSPIIFQAQQVF